MSEYGKAEISVGDGVPTWEPDATEQGNILYYNRTNNHLYSWDGSTWSDRDSGGGGGEAFPVGAVYTSITGTDPATELGYGTWTAFATGQTLVGYHSGDADFGTVEATGGEKTHQLTVAEMPSHDHDEQTWSATTGSNSGLTKDLSMGGALTTYGATTGFTGGDGAHNNLQPFIVVYFWKRTA